MVFVCFVFKRLILIILICRGHSTSFSTQYRDTLLPLPQQSQKLSSRGFLVIVYKHWQLVFKRLKEHIISSRQDWVSFFNQSSLSTDCIFTSEQCRARGAEQRNTNAAPSSKKILRPHREMQVRLRHFTFSFPFQRL